MAHHYKFHVLAYLPTIIEIYVTSLGASSLHVNAFYFWRLMESISDKYLSRRYMRNHVIQLIYDIIYRCFMMQFSVLILNPLSPFKRAERFRRNQDFNENGIRKISSKFSLCDFSISWPYFSYAAKLLFSKCFPDSL